MDTQHKVIHRRGAENAEVESQSEAFKNEITRYCRTAVHFSAALCVLCASAVNETGT